MTKKLILFLGLMLSSASLLGDEVDLSAVSSLTVDLDAVVELGQVHPVDGVTTAGQPDEASLKVFADSGYVAVIDLRTEGEDRGIDEPAAVEALGMDYINLPIGRDGITYANAKVLRDAIASYDEPVLVHCGSSNRVGALFALQAFSETGNVDVAARSGRAAGLTRMEDTVRGVIEAE